MSKVIFTVTIWDTMLYPYMGDAEKADAAIKIELEEDEYAQRSIDTMVKLMGDKVYNDPKAFAFHVVQQREYHVSAQVLEWNKYTVAVRASSESAAIQLVNTNGIVHYETQDVEWGNSPVFNDEVEFPTMRNVKVEE